MMRVEAISRQIGCEHVEAGSGGALNIQASLVGHLGQCVDDLQAILVPDLAAVAQAGNDRAQSQRDLSVHIPSPSGPDTQRVAEAGAESICAGGGLA
jgi:hypothetical protein